MDLIIVGGFVLFILFLLRMTEINIPYRPTTDKVIEVSQQLVKEFYNEDGRTYGTFSHLGTNFWTDNKIPRLLIKIGGFFYVCTFRNPNSYKTFVVHKLNGTKVYFQDPYNSNDFEDGIVEYLPKQEAAIKLEYVI